MVERYSKRYRWSPKISKSEILSLLDQQLSWIEMKKRLHVGDHVLNKTFLYYGLMRKQAGKNTLRIEDPIRAYFRLRLREDAMEKELSRTLRDIETAKIEIRKQGRSGRLSTLEKLMNEKEP